MAKNITGHARYRLAAGAFAAAGGALCLGAMFGYHAMTLLVIGMMNLAASMLLMSLRPPKGAVREEPRQMCERCTQDKQTVRLTVRALKADWRPAKPADTTLELMTDAGVRRPRERKSGTWSI